MHPPAKKNSKYTQIHMLCTHMCTHKYTHTHMHTHTHIYTHAHMHINTHTHIYTCTHIYTYSLLHIGVMALEQCIKVLLIPQPRHHDSRVLGGRLSLTSHTAQSLTNHNTLYDLTNQTITTDNRLPSGKNLRYL